MVRIQPAQEKRPATVHHADCRVPTRKHELDHTDQESICPVKDLDHAVGIDFLFDA